MKKSSVLFTLIFSLLSISSPAYADITQKDSLTLEEVSQALGDFAGDAAESFSGVIKKVFENSGQPTALILGDEMQGSFFVGYRRGDGNIMFHGQNIQSANKIRWSAPSLGINVGASMSKVAILVYGAQNPEQLKQRFISLQGSYHVIGGAGISYLTNKFNKDSSENNIKLVYISVGLGLDAGVAVEALAFK